MKKALYFGFCLVLAMGVGCAITNYGLITDNDQTANGQGTGVVNTNGKAKIIPSSQVATLWPDGSDELFSMVDQQADGDRTITTYNNFSTGSAPTFLDDTYCNPDWNGCAIFSAPDPQAGDSDIFDGSLNGNCSGARSLSSFVSTGRYYGECGRGKVGLSDRLQLANMGSIENMMGLEGLMYDLNRNNTTVLLNNNAGVEMNLVVQGDHTFFVSTEGPNFKILADLSSGLTANMGRSYADFLRTYGTNVTTMTVVYNGLSTSWDLGAGIFEGRQDQKVIGLVNSKF